MAHEDGGFIHRPTGHRLLPEYMFIYTHNSEILTLNKPPFKEVHEQDETYSSQEVNILSLLPFLSHKPYPTHFVWLTMPI